MSALAMKYGVLMGARAQPAALTHEDALWMARSVVGEEGYDATEAGASAIVSTMLRRFAVVGSWGTVTRLVRAYSQPVQEERAQTHSRAAEISALRWDQIPQTVRRVVVEHFDGSRPLSAPAAIHFAAPWLVQQKLAANRDWRRVPVDGAGNAFVSTGASRESREPYVKFSRRSSLPLIAVGIAAALLFAGVR